MIHEIYIFRAYSFHLNGNVLGALNNKCEPWAYRKYTHGTHTHTQTHVWNDPRWNRVYPCEQYHIFFVVSLVFGWWTWCFVSSFSEGLQITCHQSFNSSSTGNEKIETIFQIVSKMASFRQCFAMLPWGLRYNYVYMRAQPEPSISNTFRM